MRRIVISAIFSVGILVAFATPAHGWSNKEHMQLTRIAAMRLMADPETPPAMKAWLKENAPDATDMAAEKNFFLHERIGIIPRGAVGLSYWTTMPDMDTFTAPGTKIAPYNVAERLLHYVDLEYFKPVEAERKYKHDLSGKPKIEEIPRDMSDGRWQRAGMLPFRVEESYKKLVESIRAGRLADKAGQFPRDDHAAKWAGYLAHYLQDNTQPQHATLDYKSALYFADKRNAPNVHAEMEYRMADDENDDHMALREAFWPLFEKALEAVEDPVKNDDLFRATLEVSMASYDALPLIGLAAQHAAGQGGTPENPEGAASAFDTEKFFRFKGTMNGRETTVMEMKAHQLAWAVKRVENVWRWAWDEATR